MGNHQIHLSQNKKAFSIIEVLVGIFVFSLWLVAIFMLLSSSMTLNELNKNKIIASNLAREQLELVFTIRDTNYQRIQPWNLQDPDSTDYTQVFSTGSYYTVESDRDYLGFPIRLEEISSFSEWTSALSTAMESYRLCIDLDNIYTYDCGAGNTPSYFYRYLLIEELEGYSGATLVPIEDAVKVTSKVIWYKNGYHEFDIKTIITDWRRI